MTLETRKGPNTLYAMTDLSRKLRESHKILDIIQARPWGVEASAGRLSKMSLTKEANKEPYNLMSLSRSSGERRLQRDHSLE